MPKIHSINVRALAEFSLLKGDLIPAAQMIDRMNDGVRGHQQLQAMLESGWQAEAYVSREEDVDGIPLRIHGRADAVRRQHDRLQILEIKTTLRDPALIGIDDAPAHLAQGQLYAYLICANEGIPEAEVTLCYYRMDGAENHFRRDYTLAELRAIFLKLARPYAEWVRALDDWEEQSAPTLNSMRFPFDNYRDGQREMAAQVYCAMRDGASTLIEAPTGIGKTSAALFGALKALGKGKVTALFYLTARTTGRTAARQALNQMRKQGVMLRSIVITAKDKCCLLEKRECFGCPYASGYYERRRDALRDALAIEDADEDAIRNLAVEYKLCPYELSLDMSEQADVIICDYNYVFDPRVRLRRYFDQKSKAGLLIDEAHNLPDRARDMLSVELSGARVESLVREVMRYEGKDSPIVQAMAGLMRALTREIDEPESLTEVPEEWITAAQTFADAAEDIGSADPEVSKLMLDAAWFARTARQFDETGYRTLILPEGRRVCVKIWCFNPAEHIRKTVNRTGGAAFFSATLAPMNHYAAQLGLRPNGEDTLLQLESPFPPENLLAINLSVSVKFSDRARTMEVVVQVIHAMAQAHPGNYLACFPSFAYLNQAYERYRFDFPDDIVLRQTPAMSERARADFIDRFKMHPRRSMVAFIVLGGVFAEGVDLPDDRLSGAAIISTGLPQIGYERNLLSELYDDGFDTGADVAYVYPGIRRVLQAAGRVIRTETDRGVIILMDARYRDEKIQELLPSHWRLERCQKMSQLKNRLNIFWND